MVTKKEAALQTVQCGLCSALTQSKTVDQDFLPAKRGFSYWDSFHSVEFFSLFSSFDNTGLGVNYAACRCLPKMHNPSSQLESVKNHAVRNICSQYTTGRRPWQALWPFASISPPDVLPEKRTIEEKLLVWNRCHLQKQMCLSRWSIYLSKLFLLYHIFINLTMIFSQLQRISHRLHTFPYYVGHSLIVTCTETKTATS